MEPGDYPTNVLFLNNFTSIAYEYFEPQALTTISGRRHLQKIETLWRQEGRLVHCDPFREGIWIFQNVSNISSPREASFLNIKETQGIGLQQKETGIYEPASLARSKHTTSTSISTPSTNSSPPSSFENTIRGAQVHNVRSVQTNAALTLLEPGTPSPGIKSGSQEMQQALKDVHEYFISAVLGSLVYFLSRDHGFLPLNSRTLISTRISSHLASPFSIRSQPLNEIEIATLDINLTSLGALVVKAYSDIATGLQRPINTPGPIRMSESLSPGASMWLAPSGNAAKFYCTLDDRNMQGQLASSQLTDSPGHQYPSSFSPLAIKSWQSKCLDWLSTKGLNTAAIEAGGWLFVQIHGGRSPYSTTDFQSIPMLEEFSVVPWPALLCFQTSGPGVRASHGLNPDTTSPRDPLLFAEDWFNGKDERAILMSKRQKERLAAESLSKEQADVDARVVQSNIHSPATLRRGSNAGAMYPTPPDAPHNQIGATPSFDGNVSTPGNPNLFVHPEIGAAIPNNTNTADVDVDLWGSSGKKDRTNSDVNFNEAENDNLFSSLDGDIFGTEVITDADFSFFDEPDDIQIDQKPISPAAAVSLGDQDIIGNGENSASSDMKAEALPDPGTVVATYRKEDPDNQLLDIASSVKLDIRKNEEVSVTLEDSHIQTPFQPPDHPSTSQPFNKEIVFKRLREQSNQVVTDKQLRRASAFNKVDFPDSLLSVSEKYSARGTFNFSSKGRDYKQAPLSGLPRTDYLRSRRKLHEEGQELGTLARLFMGKDSGNGIPDEPIDYLMASEGASQASEQDDTSHTTDETSTLLINGLKRKWENEEGDEITSSFDALAMDFEHTISTPKSINGPQLPLLDADPADWSLTGYFASPEPDVLSNVLSDVEHIATAQILTDQVVSSTLNFVSAVSGDASIPSSKTAATRKLMHSLTAAINLCLKDVSACTVRSYLEIQGLPVLNHGHRLPARPMGNPRGPNNLDSTRPNNPFPISPPQLEVRRSDSKLSILPPAVNFWENLGLGPSQGTKDITSLCIHPNFEGVSANVSIFLDQMRSVYESSRFGSHDRLVCSELPDGLLSFFADPQPNKSHQLSGLKDITGRLGRILSSLPVEGKNFVVYFIYPSKESQLLVQACSAFQHLFNLYRKELAERRKNTINELVLQLIPLDFIASPKSLTVASPSEYFHLAMEVYDRCIDFTFSSSMPAILLEQPLPKSIEFKLTATPSASLLQENTCLHVAYAQSIDDRWITAAWTDNRGTQQMTASYCLGRKNEPISRLFSDVAHEIWETTLDYISSKKIHWRIMIARVGVMDPSELDSWQSIASTESNAQVSLTLITVQPDPSLRLLPVPVTSSLSAPPANPVITPVSTPQALQSSILSPDTASTPARDNTTNGTPVDAPTEPDGDARLVDYTDQNWGAILSHRLNNSNSLIELNLALISGYLMKRGGSNVDDPPVVMEVNIIYSEVVGNPRTFHETLLREVLGYYRGLGTLARIRGVVDGLRDVRPWHIAAAEKAVKTLYMLM